MSKRKIVHIVFDITFSLLLIAVAICFAVCCVQINNLGQFSFTYENIGYYFKLICVPVYIALFMLLLGIVLNLALPLEKKKEKPKQNKADTLKTLYKKFDQETFDEESREEIKKQRLIRRVLSIVFVVLLVAGLVVSLVYCLNIENFPKGTEDAPSVVNTEVITNSIAMAVTVAFSSFAPLAIFSIVLIFVNNSSLSRELEAVKNGIKNRNSSAPVSKNEGEEAKHEGKASRFIAFFVKHKKKIILILQIVIIIVAILCIISGIFGGAARTIFEKAKAICQECVGIG